MPTTDSRGGNIFTLTNLSKVRRRAVFKVIQGHLAGFSYKKLVYAHAIDAGRIFSRVGSSPPERSE